MKHKISCGIFRDQPCTCNQASAADWQKIADELAAALNQLNTIYRSEYDEPGENPPWLREPLRKYNQLKQQTVAAQPNEES